MALFIRDIYATLWQTENKGNYIRGSVSTSEKDIKNEGQYLNSNWNTTFVGESIGKIDGLPERTRLKILAGKVTNIPKEYNGEKKSFTNLIVFDVEIVDTYTPPSNKPTNKATTAPKKTTKPTENQGGNSADDDDQLPF